MYHAVFFYFLIVIYILQVHLKLGRNFYIFSQQQEKLPAKKPTSFTCLLGVCCLNYFTFMYFVSKFFEYKVQTDVFMNNEFFKCLLLLNQPGVQIMYILSTCVAMGSNYILNMYADWSSNYVYFEHVRSLEFILRMFTLNMCLDWSLNCVYFERVSSLEFKLCKIYVNL